MSTGRPGTGNASQDEPPSTVCSTLTLPDVRQVTAVRYLSRKEDSPLIVMTQARASSVGDCGDHNAVMMTQNLFSPRHVWSRMK